MSCELKLNVILKLPMPHVESGLAATLGAQAALPYPPLGAGGGTGQSFVSRDQAARCGSKC